MELKVEREPKYKVKETETKVAAECGCGGDEPAIPRVICGHLLGLFLPTFHSCYGSSRSFESDGQRQTIFVCWLFQSLTIYTAKPTYFPHYYQAHTTFNSILRQVSSRYWPFGFLSGRPLLWDTQWGGQSQLVVLCWTRYFHTWGSKRLSELTKKLLKLNEFNPGRLLRDSWKTWRVNKISSLQNNQKRFLCISNPTWL